MANFKAIISSHEDAKIHKHERQQYYFDVYLLMKKDVEVFSKLWRDEYKSNSREKKPAEV
jgi:hypothetical protein